MAVPVFVAAGAGTGGNGTTADVPFPSGLLKDDFLIFQIWSKNNSNPLHTSVLTNAGWQEIHASVLSNDGIIRQYVYGKFATGAESGTFHITRNNVGANPFGGRMYAYRGVDKGIPTEGGATGTAGNSATCSDVGVVCGGPARQAVNLVSVGSAPATVPDFTGESGGDWTQPVAKFSAAPGGSGVCAVIQDADMPEGGTIDGGSCVMSSSGRQAKHGFALVGKLVAASYAVVVG